MTVMEISLLNSENSPMVMIVSWKHAITAPRP